MIVPGSSRIGGVASCAKQAGFTFLEVLIALCIVLIALVPLIQLHITSIRLIDAGFRMARATLLANAKLAEIVATETLEIGGSDGRVEEERGLTFQWKSTVTEADLAECTGTTIPGVRHVRVDVTWHDGRQDAAFTVDTFVHVPVQREQKDDTGDHRNRDEGETLAGRSRM
jgi:prepilin-type N-terminal cleavage/methylation domain-containing protein